MPVDRFQANAFQTDAFDGPYWEVSLNWDDNSDPDLSHYRVYRSTTSGSGYVLVADNVPASTYVDAVPSDPSVSAFYYVVRAVDTANNESGNSNEASTISGGVQPIILVGAVGIRGEA